MNTHIRDRAVKLLGACTASQTAAALGVDPSYISQLLSEPDFANAVATERAKYVESGMSKDAGWDTIEQKCLNKMTDLVEWVQKPADIMRFAMMANGAKRRSTILGNADSNLGGDTVVHLHLPAAAMVNFQLNAAKEVVAVEGKTLASIPSSALLAHVKGDKQLPQLVAPSQKGMTPDDFI